MASRDLNDLLPQVKEKALHVQSLCTQQGKFELLIYCTLRPLDEQAGLYRQSRSYATIKAKMKTLVDRGYGFLADIIQSVGPCNGPHVTNAAPGESWHNYGQAWDGVPMVHGKPLWSTAGLENTESHMCQTCGQKVIDAHPWKTYGLAVQQAGMHWAGSWTGFQEFPHAQLMESGNPLSVMSPEDVKAILKEKGLLTV